MFENLPFDRAAAKETLKRLRGEMTVGAYRAGGLIARVTPRPIGTKFSSALGYGASLAPTEKRLIVERNLRRAYGRDLSGSELSSKVARTFDSYARYYYDSLRLPGLSRTQVEQGITLDGIEHVEAAMAADGPGPVLALPHLGGWEWAAAYITRVRGWGLAAVVEALEPPELFEWFMEFRKSLGMNIIPLGPDAAAGVAKAALDKQIVCLLCDRDIGGNGIAVEFFGEMTTLPAGPAVMALRVGSPVLPTAVYFDGDKVHGVVRPALDATRHGRLRDDVTRITQALAHELEILIREAPEQWHLMSPNWPSDHEAVAAAAARRAT